jgi:hypothetical protein
MMKAGYERENLTKVRNDTHHLAMACQHWSNNNNNNSNELQHKAQKFKRRSSSGFWRGIPTTITTTTTSALSVDPSLTAAFQSRALHRSGCLCVEQFLIMVLTRRRQAQEQRAEEKERESAVVLRRHCIARSCWRIALCAAADAHRPHSKHKISMPFFRICFWIILVTMVAVAVMMSRTDSQWLYDMAHFNMTLSRTTVPHISPDNPDGPFLLFSIAATTTLWHKRHCPCFVCLWLDYCCHLCQKAPCFFYRYRF